MIRIPVLANNNTFCVNIIQIAHVKYGLTLL